MTLKRITLDMMKEESHGLRHFNRREMKKPGIRNPRRKENVNFNNVKSSSMYIRDVLSETIYTGWKI
jgi:hypothetical protein